MVRHQPSKLRTGVRFSYPAPAFHYPVRKDPYRRFKLMTKTYGIFNRTTLNKTNVLKVSRKFSTRDEARSWLQVNHPTEVGMARKYGIVNLTTMTPIR